MDYAVFRLTKLKSLSALAGISRHDKEREALPYRAHPERSRDNYHLRPAGIYSPESTLPDRWRSRVGSQKIRKNAVYGYEIVLSFSPSAAARIPVDSWARDSAQWLADSFGGPSNVLDISIHLDETTPHLHAVVVPVDSRGKLNARAFTGSRKQLSDLQTSYAEAVSSYGLSRGVRFYERPERVFHESHHTYRARQQQAKDLSDDLSNVLQSERIYQDITHNPRERSR